MTIYGKKLLNEKTEGWIEYNIQSCCSQIILFHQQWKSIYLYICVYIYKYIWKDGERRESDYWAAQLTS